MTSPDTSTSSDSDSADAVHDLVKAIQRHGTVIQYSYRPVKQCVSAGFFYTLGALIALGSSVCMAEFVAFAFGFIKGLLP